MDAAGATRQIRQMVDFIMLEAREKAHEIRTKTEHDFNLEKQMLVTNAKLKMREEFEHKKKELQVQMLIKTSKTVGEQRSRKFIARDQLMKQLLTDTKEQLSTLPSAHPQRYAVLLQGLIKQGAAQVREKDVAVTCRKGDLAVVKAAVDALKKDPELAGIAIAVKETSFLPDTCSGGVRLSGLNDKIKCDNTLDARAALAIRDLQPVVRYLLFPSCRSAPVTKPAVVIPHASHH